MKVLPFCKLGNKHFRRLFLVLIVLCLIMYFNMVFILEHKDEVEVKAGYFVNTSGCQIHKLEPLSPMMLPYLKPGESAGACPMPQLMRAETLKGKNYLVLALSGLEIMQTFALTSLDEVECFYMRVKRISDEENKLSPPKKFSLSLQAMEVEGGVQVVRIKCRHGAKKIIYHDVLFFIPPPNEKKKPSRLSVMILGLDSVSHMHYLRSFPQVAAFVETLPHVEFWGYNSVGHNSYDNLVPLLSGLSSNEFGKLCCENRMNYDLCPLLWKDFKRTNYTTCYGEDSITDGIFNYGKLGFKKQPTDFYLGSLIREMDKYTRYSLDKYPHIQCSAGRKFEEILFEFIYKLVPYLQQDGVFSFFWQNEGLKDYLSHARSVDQVYLKLLQHFQQQQILEHTLILFMSDQGMRFGKFRETYQGMQEASQPLLIALYPKWLQQKYPLAFTNLHNNQHSLVTTYDLHVTLKDLLQLKQLDQAQVQNRTLALAEYGFLPPRGISLFLPIPNHRGCNVAHIPDDYCLCHKLIKLSLHDGLVRQAARLVVEKINERILRFRKCQQLRLLEVQAGYFISRGKGQAVYEIRVQVITMPGAGQFEGTARFGQVVTLSGPLIRINQYENQSDCVNDAEIKMYCYCKKLT